MIWLTWRQFRLQAAVIGAALVALAVILALTGPQLLHLAHAVGSEFLRQAAADSTDTTLYVVGALAVIILPALIGLFWGAPLITRELENGTHRLVWNQTITRARWLATKLGLIGLTAMAAAGLLSLAVSWWSSPLDRAADSVVADGPGPGSFYLPRLTPLIFDARGIVPVGYAAFAFAVGVTAGVLLRRTVTAMAVALAAFVAIQIAMPLWVRPHLIAPEHAITTITTANLHGLTASGPGGPPRSLVVAFDKPGAWVLSDETIDSAGNPVSALPSWIMDCLPPPGPRGAEAGAGAGVQACFARLTQLGYRQQVTYHPASRYWAFQWIETGVFLALTAVLTGFCFWRVRNRLS